MPASQVCCVPCEGVTSEWTDIHTVYQVCRTLTFGRLGFALLTSIYQLSLRLKL